MNNKSRYLWLSGIIIGSSLSIIPSHKALAQFRGQDSQQFFERGNQVVEQQIQEIQKENREANIEQGKSELTNELENNNIEVNEIPSAPETPSVPTTESIPETPSLPTTESIPETPSIPTTESIPKTPSIPTSIQSIPKTPSIPSTPSIPKTPSIPATPSVPTGIQSIPKTPSIPSTPSVPKTPSIPRY